MMPNSPDRVRFSCPGRGGTGTVLQKLEAPGLQLRPLEPSLRRARLRYVDTFDWRLHGRGWTLRFNGGEWCLDTGRVETTGEGSGTERFWWDLPAGTLRDRLCGCLEERALLTLFEADVAARRLAAVNGDGKTVVRMLAEDVVVHGGEVGAGRLHSVLVDPVRGYEREFAAVTGGFDRLGLARSDAAFISAALELLGRSPGDYSSKLDIVLTTDMTARQAAGRIFRSLFDTMRRNEPGVLDDVDTEFLHDFRVAVRRTRSALTQLEGVLPAAVTRRFRAGFARLGRASNRLRDLDVYLLGRDEYRRALPPSLRPGLDPVFEAMATERAQELERVHAVLRAEDYKSLVADWERILDGLDTLAPSAAGDAPVAELARRAIRKRYRRVMRAGAAVTGASPDADLHALRIQCKKLRYLLEFFSSLFPEVAGDPVRQLKKLQDNLGRFNDCSVQQQDLRSWLEGRGGVDAPVAAAVGGLIAVVHLDQRAARCDFAGRFADFASDDIAGAFEALFPEVSR